MATDRVLLVDDEVEFVNTLAERMTSRGLVVQTANSGDEALRKVEQATFDAVVLDLAMPGMDGIETLRRLREQQPDLQIILLTGQGTIPTAVEATKLGAMDFLEKPASIDSLLQRIREARATRLQLAEQRTAAEIEDLMARKGW